VHAIHKPVTGFGARLELVSKRTRAKCGFSPAALMGIDVECAAGSSFQPVKIVYFPCPAQYLRLNYVETAAFGRPIFIDFRAVK
jgi:hypothetical protein